MAALHIEEFYKDCARILLQLYASFPRKVTLFVEDISGADQPDDCGVHSRRYLACFGAMLWLAEEGLLRYTTTIRQDAIDQAILSRQGLLLLSRPVHWPPTDGGPVGTQPGVEVIRQLLEKGSSSRLADQMERLLLAT